MRHEVHQCFDLAMNDSSGSMPDEMPNKLFGFSSLNTQIDRVQCLRECFHIFPAMSFIKMSLALPTQQCHNFLSQHAWPFHKFRSKNLLDHEYSMSRLPQLNNEPSTGKYVSTLWHESLVAEE